MRIRLQLEPRARLFVIHTHTTGATTHVERTDNASSGANTPCCRPNAFKTPPSSVPVSECGENVLDVNLGIPKNHVSSRDRE